MHLCVLNLGWLLPGISLMLQLFVSTYGYVINNDPQYGRWPRGVVFYVLPVNEYNWIEATVIRMAMTQIQRDMQNCVQFQEVTLPVPQGINFVVITHTGGMSGSSCYTFPGMVTRQSGQGQYMAIQNGTNGCLSNTRQTMRLLSSLLGLRGEHNKPTRNNFISVNSANVNSEGLNNNVFSFYDSSKIMYDPDGFDYNSISLFEPTTFTSNGGATITANNGIPIRNIGRLSFIDCVALSWLYSCSVGCQNVYLSTPTPNPLASTAPTNAQQTATTSGSGAATPTTTRRPTAGPVTDINGGFDGQPEYRK